MMSENLDLVRSIYALVAEGHTPQSLNPGGQSGHLAPRRIELVPEPVPLSAVKHRLALSSAASWSRSSTLSARWTRAA